MPFTIEFSNALDTASFDAGLVAVDPEIPGMRIDVYGNVIQIDGATAGRTTYRVTLDGSLRDVFGQTLGEDTELTFDVGPAKPTLYGLQRDWITTDPMAAAPTVSIQTVNHDDVHVEAWAVTAADLTAFRSYLERTWSDTDPGEPQWPKVMDETVAIDGEADRFVETAIDLSEAFAAAGSQLVVRVEPTESYAPNTDEYWNNRPTVAWVQSTTLGVDAIADNDELLIWTTDLTTGAPVGERRRRARRRRPHGDDRCRRAGAGRARRPVGDWTVGVRRRSPGAAPELVVPGVDALDTGRRGALVRVRRPRHLPPGRDRAPHRLGAPAAMVGRHAPAADPGCRRGQLPGHGSAGGRARLGHDAAQRARRVQPRARPPGGRQPRARLRELLDRTAGCRPVLVRSPVPDPGVPPPRVLGHGAHRVERAVLRRPARHRRRRRRVLRRRAAPGRTGRLAGDDPADVVSTAQLGRLHVRDLAALVVVRQRRRRRRPAGRPATSSRRASNARRAPAPNTRSTPVAPTVPARTISRSTSTRPTSTCRAPSPPRQRCRTSIARRGHRAPACSSMPRATTSACAATAPSSSRGRRSATTRSSPTSTATSFPAARSRSPPAGSSGVYENGEWQEQLADEQECTLTSTADATDGSMRCEFPTTIGGTYRITAVVADDTGHRNRTQTTTWVSGGPGPADPRRRPAAGDDRARPRDVRARRHR